MKTVLILATLISMGLQANAAKPAAPKKQTNQQICEKLHTEAEEQCDESLCEDYLEGMEEGTECERDGDFGVALQECTYADFSTAIEQFNKTIKGKKLNCDDLGL